MLLAPASSQRKAAPTKVGRSAVKILAGPRQVMATIGVTIGVSFAASMILGPVLNGWIGVPGIFWLT